MPVKAFTRYLASHTVPFRRRPVSPDYGGQDGTDPSMRRSGNKLPGLRRAQASRYDHIVPPGQDYRSPVC
jgi:hypothetical protein